MKILRWVGMVVAAPIVVVFVMIMYFVIQTELAHDDADCPFDRVETRALDDGTLVHEESRRCQDEVEEHRWLLDRGGEASELGRRRLPTDRYAAGEWSWSLERGDRGVHVRVQNDGVEPGEYYERPSERRE